MLDLSTVAKRCVLCGAEWLGNTFQPPQPDEALPRLTRCDACLNAEDESHRARLHPVRSQPQPVELSVFREPGE